MTSGDANKLDCIEQKLAALCFSCFFPHVHYNYAYALEQLKLHTVCKRRYRLDAPFLFKFTLVLNSVLFWKLLVFEFLLGVSETFLCMVSALQVKSVPVLDALHLLMFVGMLMYLEPKLFFLFIFYSGTFLLKY
jgi:hypothetical protein